MLSDNRFDPIREKIPPMVNRYPFLTPHRKFGALLETTSGPAPPPSFLKALHREENLLNAILFSFGIKRVRCKVDIEKLHEIVPSPLRPQGMKEMGEAP